MEHACRGKKDRCLLGRLVTARRSVPLQSPSLDWSRRSPCSAPHLGSQVSNPPPVHATRSLLSAWEEVSGLSDTTAPVPDDEGERGWLEHVAAPLAQTARSPAQALPRGTAR